MLDVYETLIDRGFLYQCTDEEVLRQRLGAAPVTFYVGFDPTSDSLQVGNLVPVMAAGAMNDVIRSRSTSTAACSGSHLYIETVLRWAR